MTATLLKLAYIFLGICVLLWIREYTRDVIYYFQRKKHNCGPIYTQKFWPFGLRSFFNLVLAQRKNRLLQLNHDMVKNHGHSTVYSQINGAMNVFTVDPENIKTILATSFKDYSLGLRYPQFFPLLGDGIFTLSGEGWKHSRAMLRPQFSREQISQLDSVHRHVNALLKIFSIQSRRGVDFDAQVLFHNLTLDTATEFLFGESTDSLFDILRDVQRSVTSSVDGKTLSSSSGNRITPQQFADSFNECLEILSLRSQATKLYFLVYPPHFSKHIKVCKDFVDYFVNRTLSSTVNPTEKEDRAAHGDKYVFIEELAKETRDPLVMRDQSFNILLAGRDTTASLLSYITYFLAQDKRVWAKLRETVLEHFGPGVNVQQDADADTLPENLTFETLKRCNYLNYVINEVLRLNPIVPLNFRTAIRDTILPRGGGPNEDMPVFVPKDTAVVYSVYTMQRLKSIWGEDSEEFRPERWAEGRARNWEYLPFNGGPRICLGQQFALTETAFTLVRIVQTFRDIELLQGPDPDVKLGDISHWTKLTSSVAGGVHVRFVE